MPNKQEFETVCLFADISGYTNLSENMTKKYGERGPEFLSVHLNRYFSLMVKTVASEGGDVFKYAGDAMIVLWPPDSDEDLETKICRATQVSKSTKYFVNDCVISSKRSMQYNIRCLLIPLFWMKWHDPYL